MQQKTELTNNQHSSDYGMPVKEGWDLNRIKAYTKLHCNVWFDDIYDYQKAAEDVKYKTGDPFKNYAGGQELDQHIWEEWTNKLEESRQFVFESLLDFGLSELIKSFKFC